MPTYTYRCQKCGHEFERFQSMSDEPVKRCERCRSKVQRVFHPVGIVLKGPGFHKTDYRSPSKKSTTSESSSSESKSKTEAKSDGKSSDQKTSDQKSSDKKGSSSDTSSSSDG